MNLFGWTLSDDDWYRFRSPFQALDQRKEFGEVRWDPNLLYPRWHDPDTLLVFQYFADAIPNVFDYRDKVEAPVLIDCDDPVWIIDPSISPVEHAFWSDTERRFQLMENFSRSAGVTVSTPALASCLADFLGPMCPPIEVVDNELDFWPGFEDVNFQAREESVRIGYPAAPRHVGDMQPLGASVYNVVRSVPAAEFVWIGEPTDESLQNDDIPTVLGVPDSKRIPWRPTEEYLRSFSKEYDLLVAPLAPTAFNECKSAIKVMEAASYGIPAVASNFGPYRDAVIHEETGYLCDTPEEFEEALVILTTAHDLRYEMGQAARAHMKNRVAAVQMGKRLSAYQRLANITVV